MPVFVSVSRGGPLILPEDGELQAWDSLGCQRLAALGPLDLSLCSMSGLDVDFDGLFEQVDELDPIIVRKPYSITYAERPAEQCTRHVY